jgi:hypothetical protein
VLILPRGQSQHVKRIVQAIKDKEAVRPVPRD